MYRLPGAQPLDPGEGVLLVAAGDVVKMTLLTGEEPLHYLPTDMTRLAQRRGALGLSQEQVARRAGCSLRTYIRHEHQELDALQVDTARRIAAALETTVDALWPPEPEGRTDSE